jgi:hypothetical protein
MASAVDAGQINNQHPARDTLVKGDLCPADREPMFLLAFQLSSQGF